ncbi:hypothetical protein ABR330_02820 [Bacillus cabrialesii subsp. cabrialesii]
MVKVEITRSISDGKIMSYRSEGHAIMTYMARTLFVLVYRL